MYVFQFGLLATLLCMLSHAVTGQLLTVVYAWSLYVQL